MSADVTPGDWSVKVTSTDPAGEVSGTVSVTGEPVTRTDREPATGAPTTAADPADGERDTDATALDGEAAVTAAAPVQDDGGSDTALIVGLVAATVVLVGGGVTIARARRQGDTTS